MDDIENIENIEDIDDDMEDNYDFSDAIKNPFAGMMKNGYSVTIHYGPRGEKKLYTYDEIVEHEIRRIRIEINKKIKDLPRGQLEGRLEKIFEAVKNS